MPTAPPSDAPAGDAFYLPDGPGRFVSTRHTGGPWDPRLQHAGPPSALLARTLDQQPSAWPAAVVRVAVDILGPIPVAPLEVTGAVARSGRSVELVTAELTHEGRVAARASAWRVRRTTLDLPDTAVAAAGDAPDLAVPAFPDAATALPEGWALGGYLEAMEWRVARGSWDAPGPATVWGRMRHPLVPDEEPTGVQRVMALADSGNGVSGVLPLDGWLFINPDLVVHFAAEPQGEWMCIDAATQVDAAGFGLASSRLYDRTRMVGRGAQSLLVGTR